MAYCLSIERGIGRNVWGESSPYLWRAAIADANSLEQETEELA